MTCQTHIQRKAQLDLMLTWYNLSRKLNPGVDYLIIDHASPICPLLHLDDGWNVHHFADSDEIITQESPKLFARFKDALGHPNYDGIREACGSDRGWTRLIDIAIASKYDMFVYVEADLLCVRPIAELIAQMKKPAACANMVYHGVFPEIGVFLAKPAHLARINFVKKYNWKGPTYPAGEYRAWQILYESMQFLPLKGERNRFRTAANQIQEHFPDGLDYLTHAYMSTQRAFLAQYGHEDCWHQ
jgi:hypothetical protein